MLVKREMRRQTVATSTITLLTDLPVVTWGKIAINSTRLYSSGGLQGISQRWNFFRTTQQPMTSLNQKSSKDRSFLPSILLDFQRVGNDIAQ